MGYLRPREIRLVVAHAKQKAFRAAQAIVLESLLKEDLCKPKTNGNGVDRWYARESVLEADTIVYSTTASTKRPAKGVLTMKYHSNVAKIDVLCSKLWYSAKPLLMEAFRIARRRGMRSIELDSVGGAIAYYRRAGFAPKQEVMSRSLLLSMRKNLTASENWRDRSPNDNDNALYRDSFGRAIASNSKTRHDVAALRFAAVKGDAGWARRLLDAGANPNAADKNGYTALIFAAGRGDRGIVQMLLKAGANPSAASKSGVTALIRADARGHRAIVQVLRNAIGKKNAPKQRKQPPRPASKPGKFEPVRSLNAAMHKFSGTHEPSKNEKKEITERLLRETAQTKRNLNLIK